MAERNQSRNQNTQLADILAERARVRRERARIHFAVDFAAVRKGAQNDGRGKILAPIEPGVLAATAEELIAAGWGEYARHRIPADWREHGPRNKFSGYMP